MLYNWKCQIFFREMYRFWSYAMNVSHKDIKRIQYAYSWTNGEQHPEIEGWWHPLDNVKLYHNEQNVAENYVSCKSIYNTCRRNAAWREFYLNSPPFCTWFISEWRKSIPHSRKEGNHHSKTKWKHQPPSKMASRMRSENPLHAQQNQKTNNPGQRSWPWRPEMTILPGPPTTTIDP